jgi:hypothetical protein
LEFLQVSFCKSKSKKIVCSTAWKFDCLRNQWL